MHLSTARQLAALNRRFYDEHAENFADSRPRLAAGVQRVLAAIPAGARVLELGCGDGKVGRALARQGVGAYLGLDASEAMLNRARRFMTTDDRRQTTVAAEPAVHRPSSIVFLPADLTNPSWPSVLPPEPFHWSLAFAVFHHLPGFELRAAVLRAVAGRLAPGGRVALSNWQFTRSPRASARIVPWAQAGLCSEDVEPGDALLTWERKGTHGMRYVHLIDHAEAERLAAEAGLSIIESFSADGLTGNMTDYVVMSRGD
jgi:tRNA (uracil-5-)-methyltransferase TRM9